MKALAVKLLPATLALGFVLGLVLVALAAIGVSILSVLAIAVGVAAAVLSDRYITARFLPDKAIDLIDESASRLRIEIDSMPEEIDELTRRRIQLEIEREALKKEKDKASRERLAGVEQEIADLTE